MSRAARRRSAAGENIGVLVGGPAGKTASRLRGPAAERPGGAGGVAGRAAGG